MASKYFGKHKKACVTSAKIYKPNFDPLNLQKQNNAMSGYEQFINVICPPPPTPSQQNYEIVQ